MDMRRSFADGASAIAVQPGTDVTGWGSNSLKEPRGMSIDSEHPERDTDPIRYEIRFQSLFKEGRALTFPCDAQGHVDIDSLSERARTNYLYARAVVGLEYTTPEVRVSALPN